MDVIVRQPLDLTINPSTTSSSTVTACDDYLWNGTVYTASGTYTYSTTNSNGCDSTATLNLTITTCVSPFIGLVITTVPNTTGGFTSGEQTYRLYA